MVTLFVRGLPPTTTDSSLNKMFGDYGKVFSLEVRRDIFSGQTRGFATVNMEGHEARAAIVGLDGRDIEGNTLHVALDKSHKGGRGRR